MNTFHISKCDGIHRQNNIPILKLANRIKHDTIDALVFDEYGGRHLLRFLRGHNKNHRAKDDGQCHRQQYISIVYHHGAKVHFFRPCSVIFHKSITNASCICVSPTRCPRALSAHPTLRPNGLMWGYWDNVPLARGCRNTLSSYISQVKVTQNWHMSRVSSDFIGVTSDLHRS